MGLVHLSFDVLGRKFGLEFQYRPIREQEKRNKAKENSSRQGTGPINHGWVENISSLDPRSNGRHLLSMFHGDPTASREGSLLNFN